MDPTTAGTNSAEPVLSGAHLEFLVAFARAVQRHSMYPAGHPAVKPAARTVTETLVEALGGETSFRLRVARDRFVIGGATTDPGHPLLGNLARRVHAHQLLGITFMAGLEEEEASDFLTTLADPGGENEPLGARGAEELERWRHVLLEPVPYESLTLSQDDERGLFSQEDPADFWERVGSWVGTGASGSGRGDATGPEAAEASSYDRLIENILPELARGLTESGGDDTTLREGISRLILTLEPHQLRKLLRTARSTPDLDELPEDPEALEELSARAVDELIEAADDRSKQDVPIWLIRLLTKIGMYAESASEAPGSEPDRSLCSLVQQLAGGWDVDDAKPVDYEEALGELINRTPVLEPGRRWVEDPRPLRLVRMGLECDATGDTFGSAVQGLIEEDDGLPPLLEMLDQAPADSRAAAAAWRIVATPERLRGLLEVDVPDFELIDRLLPRLGLAAVDPMLDTLIGSESTSVRREVFDRVVGLGPRIGPRVVERLEDERWFVRRNMLALLDRLPSWPADFTPVPYLTDPEARVRHEAVKLALRVPEERERAIVTALGEEDRRTVALGLAAAEESCPAVAVPLIVQHVLDDAMPPGLRIRGVRALGSSRAPEAWQTLLRLVWVRRWLFFGGLAPRSPVMLESLAALASNWSDVAEVRRVLKRAAKSDDPVIQRAATGRGMKE